MNTKYFSAVETAKLIRAQLKKNFPATKFSVKTSTYSGGASINIRWFDGPTSKAVDKIVGAFSGKGFDGMIDMAYYKTSYLMPDGSVGYLESEGTEMSRGSVPSFENKLPEGAVAARFGADYIFTERDVTAPVLAKAVEALAAKFGDQFGKDEILANIEESEYGAYIKHPLGDRNVFGEKEWNLHWTVGSQVGVILAEMSV